jgi:lipid-binding SYLF domain-containing protein
MKKSFWSFIVILLGGFIVFPACGLKHTVDKSDTEPNLRIQKTLQVIEEFTNSPDRGAAASLMKYSAGVAIFPSVYKGAWFFGAQYGKGVLCAHDKVTGEWSAPAFFTVAGGSLGFQWGAQATDLILVIMNQRGLESLLKGKGTLGADLSVAAGPIGRKAQIETDVLLKAEIYSYSRAKGAFLGIALKGAVVAPDKGSNQAYYGYEVWDPEDILLKGKVAPKGLSLDLVNALERFVK